MINTDAKFHNINTRLNELSIVLRNIQALIQTLKNQSGQLTRANSECSPGSLLSNTESNPRQHLKANTLRSGKQVETLDEIGHITKEKGPTMQDSPSTSKSANEKYGIPPPP